MAIAWNRELSTGVEWQDIQHKELFNRINGLLDAMTLGLGKEEVGRLFKFLDDYFEVHFNAEESAMLKYDYPGTLTHLAEHAKFIDDITRLKEEAASGPTTSIVIKAQRRVVDWLLNHIGVMDKSLGAFLVKAGEGKSGKGKD